MPDEPLPVGPVAAPAGFDAWYSGTATQAKPSFDEWYGTPPAPPTIDQEIQRMQPLHAVAGPAIREELGQTGGLRNFNFDPNDPRVYDKLRQAAGETIDRTMNPQLPMPAAPEGVFRNIVAAPGRLVIGAANMVLGAPAFAAKTAFNAGAYVDELVEAHKAVKNAPTRAEQVAAEDRLQEVNAKALRAPYDLSVALGGIITREAESVLPLTREMFDARGGWQQVLTDLKADPAGSLLPAAGLIFGGLKGGKALYERKVDPQVFARAGASIEAIENQPITPKEWATARYLSAIIADWDVNPSTHRWAERGLAKIAAGEGISDSFAKRAIQEGGPSFKKIWESAAPAEAAPVAPVQTAPPEVPYVPPPETLPPGVDQIVENFGNRLLQADTPTKAAAVWKIIENNVDKVPGLRGSRSYDTLHDIYARKLVYWVEEAKKAGKEPPAAEVAAPKAVEPAAAPAPAEVAPAPVAELPVPTAGEAPPIRAAMPEAAGVARVGQPGGGGVSVRESLKPPTEAPAAETLTADSILTDLAAVIRSEEVANKGESAMLKTLKMENPEWASAVLDHMRGKPVAGDIAAGLLTPDQLAKVKNLANLNLNRLDLTPADRAMLQRIVSVEAPAKFIHEPMPLPQTAELAAKLIREGKYTVEDLLATPESQKYLNPAKQVAARDLLVAVTKRAQKQFEDLAKAFAEQRITREDFQLQKDKLLMEHTAVAAKVSGLANEAGRALSAWRVVAEALRAGAEAKKFMEGYLDKEGLRPGGAIEGQKPQMWYRQALGAVRDWVRKVSDSRVVRMGVEWATAMKLTNPMTHVVNFLSNVTNSILVKPLTSLVRGATSKEAYVGEIGAEYAGMMAGWHEAAITLRETLKTGEYPWETGMRFDEGIRQHEIPGRVGKIVNSIFTALKASDAWSQSLLRSQEYYTLAYRQAAKEGLTGPARIARMTELVGKADFLVEHLDAVRKTSEYYTGNQSLGQLGGPMVKDLLTGELKPQVPLMDIVGRLDYYGKLCIDAKRRDPVLGFFIPFIKTCTNFAKMSVEYSPLNIPNLIQKANRGELTGLQMADARAKVILGTAIGTTVYIMAMNGMITGGPPSDANERLMRERAGERWNCFKIGNVYIPYSWNLPLGMIMGMAADLAELSKRSGDPEKQTNLASGITTMIRHNIGDQTFMQGLNDLMASYNDPERQGGRWLQGQVTGIAVPAGVGALARIIDPERHRPQGVLEAVQARVPFWSKGLPPMRDLWGRPLEYPGGAAGAAIGATRAPSIEKADPVDQEIARLNLKLGLPSKSVGVKGKHYTLEPLEYDLFQEQSGGEAYDKVARIVDSSRSDEAKIKAIRSTVEQSREHWMERFKRQNWLRMQEEAK
jgi:hypothetical protein